MNTTELMIGDWIEYNNETMEVIFNARVTEVGKDYIKTDHTSGDECFADEVEPIPVSRELLDKLFKGRNGDTSMDRECRYYEVNDDYTIVLPTRGDAYLCYNYDDSEIAAHDRVWLMDLPGVHILQHALALFGIYVEIKL